MKQPFQLTLQALLDQAFSKLKSACRGKPLDGAVGQKSVPIEGQNATSEIGKGCSFDCLSVLGIAAVVDEVKLLRFNKEN
jgi:hypothetical protein